MQRIINDPNLVVEDMLNGFVDAHSDIIYRSQINDRVIVSKTAQNTKRVGIVTGGGSGHKPAFIGYCGENMVDAVAVGEIFSSPSAKTFFNAIEEVDQGMGVACLYGNYAGDNMNIKMAKKMATKKGIVVDTVVANDDVASATKDEIDKRRGVAGEIFMWKVGAAKAAEGASLSEVIKASQKAIDNTRSIGVGLSSCTIPANGKPNFHIEPGTMEIGIGHHGEPGINVTELSSAKNIAEEMVSTILAEEHLNSNDEVYVLVSGLGSTPIMELYIYYYEVKKILESKKIKIYNSLVGNYFTSLDMNGLTLSLMKMDPELKKCMELHVNTSGLKVI